jgi:hypothetical protein
MLPVLSAAVVRIEKEEKNRVLYPLPCALALLAVEPRVVEIHCGAAALTSEDPPKGRVPQPFKNFVVCPLLDDYLIVRNQARGTE